MLQLPGDDTSSVTLAPGREGVFGWNSRGARLARAISPAFIIGGGEVRFGDILPLAGGGDGGDCLPPPDDVDACPLGGRGTSGEGGDSLFKVDCGDPDEVPAAGGDSSASEEPAGPGFGLRPSRKALAISAAFHFEYLIFSSLCTG